MFRLLVVQIQRNVTTGYQRFVTSLRNDAFLLVLLAIPGCGMAGDYGVMQNRFSTCPDTPNCVSSRAGPGGQYIDPIKYGGTLENARLRLLEVIVDFSRARVVREERAYLHLVFTSLVFRFVDDVEFEFDDSEKLIHMKSASRTGTSDFGVNRRRLESIREKFTL